MFLFLNKIIWNPLPRFGFDFKGTYDKISPFEKVDETTTKVTEIFESDPEQPAEMQRKSWYAILDHFQKLVENN